MAGFRGLHIVAGIAAMGVAAALGMLMELNNTAVFTSSCVVYVAVSMWAQGRLSRHRTKLQGLPQRTQRAPDGAALDRDALDRGALDRGTLDRGRDQLSGGEGNAA